MNGVGRFYGSTIGKKIVMAVSGAVWIGYVVVHMSGNLLAYLGPSAINDWAAFLKSTLPLLWGTRILLVIALIVHIHAAYSLKRLDRCPFGGPLLSGIPGCVDTEREQNRGHDSGGLERDSLQ